MLGKWSPAVVIAAAADGNLRVWDVEGIKEEKVIDLASRESGVRTDNISYTMLVNGDQWVACLSDTKLGLFDVESGLYMKTIDLQVDQDYYFSSG